MPPAPASALPPIGSGSPHAPPPSPARGSRRSRRARSRRWPPIASCRCSTFSTSPIEVVDLPRVDGRPFGPRFGTLVHTTLATVPLDADEATIRAVAATQGRILLGSGAGVDEEVYAVVEAVTAVLRHPLFDQVRAAELRGALLSRAAADLAGSGRHADRRHHRPGLRRGRRQPGRGRLQDRPRARGRGRALPAAAGDLLPGARVTAG